MDYRVNYEEIEFDINNCFLLDLFSTKVSISNI